MQRTKRLGLDKRSSELVSSGFRDHSKLPISEGRYAVGLVAGGLGKSEGFLGSVLEHE